MPGKMLQPHKIEGKTMCLSTSPGWRDRGSKCQASGTTAASSHLKRQQDGREHANY